MIRKYIESLIRNGEVGYWDSVCVKSFVGVVWFIGNVECFIVGGEWRWGIGVKGGYLIVKVVCICRISNLVRNIGGWIVS